MSGFLLLSLVSALANAPAQTTAGPSADRTRLTFRVEGRAERFEYHVENPSAVEPGPLVPHFFEQRYESGTAWLLARIDYRLGHAAMATEVGITPHITTPGTDVDTFFQRSGDVVTSGTHGDVRLNSLSLQHWIDMSEWRGWRIGVTVFYRRSTMDFLPSDRIVTHSRPPSEIREPVGGDETTWSHVFESGVTMAVRGLEAGAWRFRAEVEALPLTRARLTISLPLKYPDELIRQDAFGLGARGRLLVERRWGGAAVGASVTVGRVWSYRQVVGYREQRAAADVFLRLGR